jgi:hypothetical protein
MSATGSSADIKTFQTKVRFCLSDGQAVEGNGSVMADLIRQQLVME